MYDDLTVEQREALRSDVRLARHALISGQRPAEICYCEQGEKFHPASPELCELTVARINSTIARNNGWRTSAIFLWSADDSSEVCAPPQCASRAPAP